MDSDKKWFLTRKFRFLEINRVFTELGVLLIDGDALINHLVGCNDLAGASNQELQVLGSKVEIFFENLRERGFRDIKVVLFKDISRLTSGVFNLGALFGSELLVFDG